MSYKENIDEEKRTTENGELEKKVEEEDTSSFTLTVKNTFGIHFRSATLIVNYCRKFNEMIMVGKNGKRVDAKSILGLLTLGIKQGENLTFYVPRNLYERIYPDLKELFDAKFYED